VEKRTIKGSDWVYRDTAGFCRKTASSAVSQELCKIRIHAIERNVNVL